MFRHLLQPFLLVFVWLVVFRKRKTLEKVLSWISISAIIFSILSVCLGFEYVSEIGIMISIVLILEWIAIRKYIEEGIK